MQQTTMAVAFERATSTGSPSPLAKRITSALRKGRGRRRFEHVQRKRRLPEQQRKFELRLERMGLYAKTVKEERNEREDG